MLVGCFAVYVAGLAPSVYWLDSSELAAGAFELGVAHPPGHPLALLVGKACALVPLGSVALRVGLASAVAGAVAAALTALVASQVAQRVGRALGWHDPLVEAALGAGAGLGYGLSYAAAFQAVRPEVYALHAALAMAAAWSLLRFEATGERRWLFAAALAVGLALANHHLLALAFAAPAALFALARRPLLGWRALGLCAIAGAAGVALYLYLPLRAGRHPEVDWGAPTTPARFLWTVSARAFQKSLAHAQVGSGAPVAFALAGELGLSAPLALLGGYLLVRLRETRRVGLLLVGAVTVDSAVPALVGFDSANPDAYGYLAPAVALAACLAAAAPMAILALLQRRRPGQVLLPRSTALCVGGAMAALSALAWPRVARTRFHDTDRMVGALLSAAPPRAALVSSNFQTVFALWYLRGVEGRRPDVDHVHRHFLAYPGYRDEVARRFPALAPSLGGRDVVGLPALARQRAVLLEYDLDLDPDLTTHLLPGGTADALQPAPPDPAALDAAEETAARRIAALDATLDSDEPQTRRALFWRDFLDGARSCRAGRVRAGRAALDRARSLMNGAVDPDLEELARGCVASEE